MYDRGDLTKLRIQIRDDAGALADPDELILRIRKPAGEVEVRTLADHEIANDSTGEYSSDLTLSEGGQWSYRWEASGKIDLAENGSLTVGLDDFIEPYAPPVFASVDDVRKRLKRSELSAEETEEIELLLEGASAVIGEAIEWPAEALDPTSPVLRYVTLELVMRSLANPAGADSRSVTLGAYSRSESFNVQSGGGMALSKTEELLVRRAVWGSVTTSVRIPSHIDDIYTTLTGGS